LDGDSQAFPGQTPTSNRLGVTAPAIVLRVGYDSRSHRIQVDISRHGRELVLAGQEAATREWWETQRGGYELFISELVIQEVSRGDREISKARLALLERMPMLQTTEEAGALAGELISAGVMPAMAAANALHIAIAAVHGMDFLLTWNCKHINNAHTARRIEELCREVWSVCPVICTPEELS
jgi:predicted nucleic acid-binding protein